MKGSVARLKHTRITSGCCRTSPVDKTLGRAMPVAHPGCPMDHIQALANRSPGDLWVRCIGTLLDLFSGLFSVSWTKPGKFFCPCI